MVPILTKYLLAPLIVLAGLIVLGPSLTYGTSSISRIVLAVFFLLVMVMGLILIYREHRSFIKNGGFSAYGIALGFLVLSVFSAGASLSFIFNNSTVIGWLVQAGTLLAAIWMLVFSLNKNTLVDEEKRNDVAFLYPVLIIVFSVAIGWLIFIFGDFLPVVVDKTGWGTDLLIARVLATLIFSVTAVVLTARKNYVLFLSLVGALLLLAVGSLGVAYLYWYNILGNHPLIWLNRVLTLGAFWLVIKRPQ